MDRGEARVPLCISLVLAGNDLLYSWRWSKVHIQLLECSCNRDDDDEVYIQCILNFLVCLVTGMDREVQEA